MQNRYLSEHPCPIADGLASPKVCHNFQRRCIETCQQFHHLLIFLLVEYPMQFGQFGAERSHGEINFFQVVRQLGFPDQVIIQQFAGDFGDGAFRYLHIAGDISPFNTFMHIDDVQNVQA